MKISIIVAVYNAQHCMSRMIDSLLRQSFTDFELIIVNDGSKDGSALICDAYAQSDSRVRVIHKENGGVSSARQTGLDAAMGDYVIHADADDYVEEGMLSALYSKAVESGADVVFSDFYRDEIGGEIVYCKQEPPQDSSKLLIDILTKLHGSCWNKLVRRSLFEKYNVKFPPGLNYCEDLITWVQLFQRTEIKVAYVDKAYYHYVVNPSSITNVGNIEMYNTIYKFTQTMAQYLPKENNEIKKYLSTLPIAPFLYSFSNRLFPKYEILKEYKRLEKVLKGDTRSIRGKLGYLCLDMRLVWLAHRMLFGKRCR